MGKIPQAKSANWNLRTAASVHWIALVSKNPFRQAQRPGANQLFNSFFSG